MNCLNCGRGRPRLWVDGQGFCDEECFQEWRRKEKNRTEFEEAEV